MLSLNPPDVFDARSLKKEGSWLSAIKNGDSPFILIMDEAPADLHPWVENALGLMAEFSGIGAIVYGQESLPDGDWRLRRDGLAPFKSLSDLNRVAGPYLLRRAAMQPNTGVLPIKEFLLEIRKKGWRVLLCRPKSLSFRPLERSGEPAETAKREGYSEENLLFLSRNFPALLPEYLTKHFSRDKNRQEQWTDEFVLKIIGSIVKSNDSFTVADSLLPVCRQIASAIGVRRMDGLLANYELSAGYRPKPSLAIYDHALHMRGGGQKYACAMAELLQSDYEITFLVNKPVSLREIENWYQLRLDRCRVRLVRLPFFDAKNMEFIDQGLVKKSDENPFDLVSRVSAEYDIFLNVNMITKLKPRSSVSIFLCHFPDSKKEKIFYVQDYTYLIANSKYTIEWLKKRWQLEPTVHIYPPINMKGQAKAKQPFILSVARFDQSGFKRQLEMIDAFNKLCRLHPVVTKDWQLVMAGGSYGKNPYLRAVQAKAYKNPRIHVHVNINSETLTDFYERASIFWHACGLNANSPEKIEHFGMTTVEAMQNSCVPIVINKGGQREIVEQGVSGFLFESVEELILKTERLIADKEMRASLAKGAYERSLFFDKAHFDRSVRNFFETLNARHFSFKEKG